VTSVCTGAMLLTAAGPARGKRVTTHWNFVKTLRERGEASEVLDNFRYVRDGNLVTAAGVSAGIDMALWLVGQWYGPEFARGVQRYMEYDPAPPYAGLYLTSGCPSSAPLDVASLSGEGHSINGEFQLRHAQIHRCCWHHLRGGKPAAHSLKATVSEPIPPAAAARQTHPEAGFRRLARCQPVS